MGETLVAGTGICKSSAGKRQWKSLIGCFLNSYVSVKLSPCEVCGTFLVMPPAAVVSACYLEQCLPATCCTVHDIGSICCRLPPH
jgi:hypothetical protein